jgi:hypothetical protein
MTPVYMFNEQNSVAGGDVVSSWSDVTLKGNLTLAEALKIHGDKVYKLACVDNPNQHIIVAKTNDQSQFYWNEEVECWVAANDYTRAVISRSTN